MTSSDAVSTSIAGANRRNIPFELIEDARRHVYEAAVRTPLVRLDCDRAPAEIYLKLENLQPIGSFKIRGAYNAVRLLPAGERERGVWTVSAGNAAQGVALAAIKAGVPCRVLVMDTAPATKLEAIRRLGAEIVKASFDECWKALGERRHPAITGAFVHPFEDDEFIAGNATCGLEILEDLPDVDAIVAAFGGGGLSCGIASVMQARKPTVKIFAAEPETASPLVRDGLGAGLSGLESKLGGWLRRQERFSSDVGARESCSRGLGGCFAGRNSASDEARGPGQSRDCGRRGCVRRCCRAHGKMRARESGRGGKRRKY